MFRTCTDSSSSLEACTCSLLLISRAFPTNSVMADKLINVKLTAPAWCNNPPLNSCQLCNTLRLWSHVMPSGHTVTVPLDSYGQHVDAALLCLVSSCETNISRANIASWQQCCIVSTSCWQEICRADIKLKAKGLVHLFSTVM